MIGTHLKQALLEKGYTVVGVDRCKDDFVNPRYTSAVVDLADADALKKLYIKHEVTHTVHLAALAHTAGVDDLSYQAYYTANVANAENVFEAGKNGRVLFISTVDVYGFAKDKVNGESQTDPVSDYAKTKALAEESCKKICKSFNIYRLSPVYTDEIKRDIQKRYYLKYPDWAYIIGGGSFYEVLNVRKAVQTITDWMQTEPDGKTKVIKDDALLSTAEKIKEEKRRAGQSTCLKYRNGWSARAMLC